MFIVIDGVDYTGKTTLAHKLKLYFESRGERAEVFSNPLKKDISAKIRDLFKSKHYRRNHFLTDSLLMSACLLELHMEMKYAIDSGITHLIVDRHILSGVVYQGYQNERVDDVKDFYMKTIRPILIKEGESRLPDIYFVMQIDEEEYLKRKKIRDKTKMADRFDTFSLERMMGLQDGFIREINNSVFRIHHPLKENTLYYSDKARSEKLIYGNYVGLFTSQDNALKNMIDAIEKYRLINIEE